MPAVMTFWNADESFNQKETERYIQWVLDCGAHSLSVTGSTGENISMSDDEQKKIIECLVKFVDHQVPVYPGTGKYGTAQTIEMTKFAQKCGAEGALVIMPYYLIPHKRAVVNHFKKLREAVGDDFDIILYNNPRFCGYQFEPIELKEPEGRRYRWPDAQLPRTGHGPERPDRQDPPPHRCNERRSD